VKKVRTNVILTDRKPLKRYYVLTEEELHDICHRLQILLENLCGSLAQQSGVSVGSAWKATELLHIQPYKISVVSEIKPVNYEKSNVS
jgi:hypothetical protein